MLQVRNLTKRFGGLEAVSNLEFDIGRSEILGLIGPNGSGKSTTINMLAGFLSPTSGRVFFKGENITGVAPYRIAQKGIARVFQRNLVFRSFTVLENVLAGFHIHSSKGVAEIFYRHAGARFREEAEYEKAEEILEYVGLSQYGKVPVTNLPHGSQRVLCLAIAIATEPELLLLDEPLTGMNAEETRNMIGIIAALRKERGITSIIIEHNVKAIQRLCERVIVLNHGKKIAEGVPKEIVEDPEVIEAYLGVEQDAT